MKNKLIIIVLGLLFSTGFVDAMKKKQPAKGRRQKSTVKNPVTQVPRQQVATNVKKTIDAEQFTNLYVKLEPMLPTQALNIINQIRDRFDLSSNQKIILDKLEEKKISIKAKRVQAGKLRKKVTQPSLPQKKVERAAKGEGWFSKLWDYESSLTQYIPTTALGGAATALAAYFALPAVASYLTIGLAAKLGVLAFGADRIYYSYNQGTLTEGEAIKDLKQLVNLELADGGRYPTLKSKQEALEWIFEFPGLRKESKIGRIVLEELRAENDKARGVLQSTPTELKQEKAISTMVDKLRDQFDFDIENPESYIAQLEDPKQFIDKNMTDENAIAIIRAICSELLRMKIIRAVQDAPSEIKETEVEEQPGFMERAKGWFYGAPKGEKGVAPTGIEEAEVEELLQGV